MEAPGVPLGGALASLAQHPRLLRGEMKPRDEPTGGALTVAPAGVSLMSIFHRSFSLGQFI
jgi:hypothetical protein